MSKDKPKPIDKITEAKQLLDAEKKRIAETCGKEIQEAVDTILKKHNCDFSITGQFQGNTISTGFAIVPKE